MGLSFPPVQRDTVGFVKSGGCFDDATRDASGGEQSELAVAGEGYSALMELYLRDLTK